MTQVKVLRPPAQLVSRAQPSRHGVTNSNAGTPSIKYQVIGTVGKDHVGVGVGVGSSSGSTKAEVEVSNG